MLRTLGEINPPDSLIIFNRFSVDRTLPKHAEAEAERKRSVGMSEEMSIEMSGGNSMTIFGNSKSRKPPSPPRGWLAWLKARLNPPEPEPEPVSQVFATIKASAEELAEWGERNSALDEMIERARTASQKELVTRLEAEKVVRLFENALYVKGRRKLLTEQQHSPFTPKCEKGLCLDWVKDFIRPIPPEIVAEKAQCDADHLFDNYAVLHFDPEERGTSPEARERAKDPILFGLLKGSRKLYFIGDWVDEQCDLTFQQIIDKLDSPLEIPESFTT